MAIISSKDGSVSFSGLVIATFEIYLGDGDGSYHASVWVPELQEVKTVCLGAMGYGSCDDAHVDANFDNCPGLREVTRKEINELIDRELTDLAERQEIVSGDNVVVFKGRKLPKGTKGKVFWIGDSGYGTSVGLTFGGPKGPNGRYEDAVFVAYGNVKLENPVTFTLSDEAREQILRDNETFWFGASQKHRIADVRRAVAREATRTATNNEKG